MIGRLRSVLACIIGNRVGWNWNVGLVWFFVGCDSIDLDLIYGYDGMDVRVGAIRDDGSGWALHGSWV